MTLSTTSNSIQHTGDGVETNFIFDFRVDDTSDFEVYVGETLQTYTTDYAVDSQASIGNPAGGTIVFVTPPGSGLVVTISRVVPIIQDTDYQPYDPFPADVHEAALDYLTMVCQQINEVLSRTLTYPEYFDPLTSNLLPEYESGKYLIWHSTEKRFINIGGTDGIGLDPDAIHVNQPDEIAGIAEKMTPLGADMLVIEDAQDSNNKKRIAVGNLPTAGGGEANTISPAGTGVPITYQKLGIDLQFNNIKSENSKLTAVLDAVSHDVELTVEETNIDHDNLLNYVAGEHFLESAISHLNIQDTGTNSHAAIDAHIADPGIHFAEAAIDHVNIQNIGSNTHSQIDSHIADAGKHREINDLATGTTDLWSGNKIDSELGGKAPTVHTHTESDITDLVHFDADAIHDNVADEIAQVAEKVTPAAGDFILIEDSAAANAKKRIQVGNLPTGGGGEANTASSVGSGTPVYKQKTGIDLEFNAIKSENNRLSVALDGVSNDVELTVVEGNINHNALANYLATEHFTEASINHNAIQNSGINTHSQIDTHIGEGSVHFTEASINHNSIQNTGLNSHGQIDTHIAAANPHSGSLANVVEDITPQLGGNLDLNDKALEAIIYNGTGVSLTKGDIVFISGDQSGDPSVTDADADGEVTASRMLVMVNETIPNLSTGKAIIKGVVSGFTGLTPGNIQYLSTTAKGRTETAPSATGQIVRIVGYAWSATEIFFDPDKTFVEIA